MKRLLQTALLMAAALSFVFSAPLTASAGHMHGSKMKHSCPAGQHWVKGYKKTNGTYVHGYCRK